MVKFLPLVLIVVLMMGVLAYVRFYRLSSDVSKINPITALTDTFQTSIPKADEPSSTASFVLKETPTVQRAGDSGKVNDQVKATPKDPSFTALESKVKNIERVIADLQIEVDNLKETQASTSATKSPLYIPLGSGGAATSLDWTTNDIYQVSLDPADYPGYKSMQLEASIRIFQGNGRGYTRLISATDNLTLTSSEISTTSQDYTWITSQGFTLPSGKKNYKLQFKTLTGYEVSIQNARIKVNF